MSIGALIVAALGLAVGLAGLYLAWRLVSRLPAERHDPPIAEDDDDAPGSKG